VSGLELIPVRQYQAVPLVTYPAVGFPQHFPFPPGLFVVTYLASEHHRSFDLDLSLVPNNTDWRQWYSVWAVCPRRYSTAQWVRLESM